MIKIKILSLIIKPIEIISIFVFKLFSILYDLFIFIINKKFLTIILLIILLIILIKKTNKK